MRDYQEPDRNLASIGRWEASYRPAALTSRKESEVVFANLMCGLREIPAETVSQG